MHGAFDRLFHAIRMEILMGSLWPGYGKACCELSLRALTSNSSEGSSMIITHVGGFFA